MLHQLMPQRRRGRAVAGAHAGRGDDARAAGRRGAQRLQQLMRAGHGAGQAFADPDRHRRRRRCGVLQHLEMVVEAGDLEDLDRRQAQQLGQGDEMAGAQAAMRVLQRVQMLDQQVAPQRQRADRRQHRRARRIRRRPGHAGRSAGHGAPAAAQRQPHPPFRPFLPPLPRRGQGKQRSVASACARRNASTAARICGGSRNSAPRSPRLPACMRSTVSAAS